MTDTNTETGTVQVESAAGVARVTLNRPETLNAWTVGFGRELLGAIESAPAPADP